MTLRRQWSGLCSGDLAHGIMEGEAEDLHVEVNGVTDSKNLLPQARPKNFSTATTATMTPGSDVPMAITRIAFFSN